LNIFSLQMWIYSWVVKETTLKDVTNKNELESKLFFSTLLELLQFST
jgi:hypothetical protein